MADELPAAAPVAPEGVISEAEFVEQYLNPAFEEIKATLAEDVEVMDKAQVHTITEKATCREVVTGDDGTETGGIDIDVEFTPFFSQLPPVEEDTEPISFDSARECALLYAISIKMIPSRLQTALNLYKESWEQPERRMYDFFKTDSLSDVTLIHPISGAKYNCHRAIVASGSRYMLEVFRKYGPTDLPRVRVPQPYDQTNLLHSDDQVSRILKYIYSNQDIAYIRDEITEDNFYDLYAQAQALGCERLKEDLRDLCMTSLLNERTVLKHYNDVVEHHDKTIMEACSQIIMASFSEIVDRGEEAIEQLLELEFSNFIATLSSDNLSVKNEELLIEIVRRYIDTREKAGPKMPTCAEQMVKPELWGLLTDEEKQTRQTAFQAMQAKKKADEEDAMNKEAELYWEKDTVDQIQHVLDIKQKERNLRIDDDTFHKIKLTEEQKIKLLSCIRWQYLSQDMLLKASADPDFVLAKHLIVQGLALKLGGPDAVRPEDLKLCIRPRQSMVSEALPEHYIEVDGSNENFMGQQQSNKGVSNQDFVRDSHQMMPAAPQSRKNIGRDIFNNIASSAQGFPSERPRSANEFAQDAMSGSKRPISSYGGAQQRFQQEQYGQSGFKSNIDMPARLHGASQKYLQGNRMLQSDIAGGYDNMPFAATQGRRSPRAARPPQNIMATMHRNEPPPTEFFFEYNFDENGVLYYLGTLGKRRNWQNPHILGQVQAFGSSIGQGCNVNTFVGRTVQNCRTEDEAYSFFGVDIGMERRLLPTCYTLRNRNSNSHVLRNWYFEGSHTGANWVILDARIYASDEHDHNASLEAEFQDFQKAGGAMTFTIDTEIYRKLGADGYRFFRIVQVGKNTNGTNNLALSGIELYGQVQGGPWQFM